MQLIQVGDVTFVKGWQLSYTGSCNLTNVRNPPGGKPTKEYYDEFFPKLAALIKTPIAFAILAPLGWNGERCWYESDKLGDYGWKPVYWKESTHKDKTWVQLHMLTLPRADLKEPPKEVNKATSVAYDFLNGQRYGNLPYLGCSSVLTSIEDGKQAIEVPKVGMYGKVDSDSCLHLMRVARPLSLANIAALKKQRFERIALLKYNQYWVRGKLGLGTKEACEY